MPTRSPLPRLTALALLLAATAACHDDATAPLTSHEQPTTRIAPALVEVTIGGIGSAKMSASASSASASDVTLSGPSSSNGISYSLSAPFNTGESASNGSVELEPLTTGSFTQGARGSDGYRYVWATFRVRNAQEDGAAYDTPRTNLTFFAATTAGTIGGSAIASLERFDGSMANPTIATGILPTGAVEQALNVSLRPRGADVLQILSESEAAAVAAPSGVEVLPYGFVVRNATDSGRTLPASPAVGQYDGLVTFAFKIPLQGTAAADPFTVSAMFLAEDDSETRITQSIEEQTSAGEAAFLARATAIGATTKTVLPGSGYVGEELSARTMCSVRTAGTSATPVAYLINRTPASVIFTNSLATWPMWAGGSVGRDLGAVALDAAGNPMVDVPVMLNLGTPGVLTLDDSGAVHMVPRRDRASTTVTASACGVSAPVTLEASGVNPLSAGYLHALALESDGSVVGWGYNAYGQASAPEGLTGVVQVAAGTAHSLALKSDGTVVGWGHNGFWQLNMPAKLTGVVQIAAGAYHSLALKSDGTVVGWGRDIDGETDIPAGLIGVVQIAASSLGTHSLALKSDGTVVGWGSPSSASYRGTSMPEDLTGVVQVSAGWVHSLALRSDGTVVGWGYDGDHQIDIPDGLTGVVQIAAGTYHSLALKSDGTVVGWGTGGQGQLDIPTGLTGVVQIAAGTYYSLAIKSDGTVVDWGYHQPGDVPMPAGLVATLP